jgi:hypothetical protein
MSYIRACEFVPSNYPPIEPIDAPLPFRSVREFETWLREIYIPRTLPIRLVDCPRSNLQIDINKTECWGIFSLDNVFERCCQVYPVTDLSGVPDFEIFLQHKIFSHNHPSNLTLSCSEVLLWANLQMKQFRAVTENCTYVIKQTNQRWPDPELLLGRIKTICPSIIPGVSLHPTGELRHKCFQLLADEGWFGYEWFDINHA